MAIVVTPAHISNPNITTNPVEVINDSSSLLELATNFPASPVVGDDVGEEEGEKVIGEAVGEEVIGAEVGRDVGTKVGEDEVGPEVGICVGWLIVGAIDGNDVGKLVGMLV